ncbi:MAG TPA: hypothetical protein VLL25_08555, partial [Acidimicrobiales bacterium]|nr:hypothetical protein [Acidimicrobiales bacterium]
MNVLNSASKLFFGIAGATLVAATVYSFANDDPTGFTVLLGIALATALAGLVLTLSGIKDQAPRFDTGQAGAPPLEMVSIDRSLLTRPSAFPLLTALALGTLAVGLAVGHAVVIIGVIIG